MERNKENIKDKQNKQNNKINNNSKHILINPDSFNLKHIFECGQCFRWEYNKETKEYIGIVLNEVISVKEVLKQTKQELEQKIIFNSTIKNDIKLKEFVNKYFNLNVEYNKIKKEILIENDINILEIKEKEDLKNLEHNIALKGAIEFGYGIRILKQDLWETVVSYIISANNNIPRIKKIINTLSEKYGNKIYFKNKEYYSFPTPEELSKATVEDLRKYGLGFRDKRVYDITKVFLDNNDTNKLYNTTNLLSNELDTNKLRNNLLKYNGIGPKIADCILLFSFNRYEVFPIDVWVRRVMNDIYFKKKDENKLTNDEILKFINRRYGKYAGIIQQYLFYWKRETNAKE